ERAVNLRVAPYVLSKVWVGIVLGVYQSGVLVGSVLLFTRPRLDGPAAYLSLFPSMFLLTLSGYLIGFAISAAAPNQNAATLMVIGALVPQFVFSGGLLPLSFIPGGDAVSRFMPTRWAFEALVLTSGMGDRLASDQCWALPKAERQRLTDARKADCPCMGARLFTQCADFPGILSPDFYDAEAQAALSRAQPVEPPLPTPFPSPTPLPTPHPPPTPRPPPVPSDPQQLPAFLAALAEQGDEYRAQVNEQFDEYRAASEAQGEEYSQAREAQGEEYASAMRAYGEARASWQESREKAVGRAEATLGIIYDNYRQAFTGTLAARWAAMLGLMVLFLALALFFQKRKDAV
ncbi:MAG: ABC transporter permease, partial [Chloroflexi bacterium]|nr:ABC transporter permease [Chloroflexota bacterium]